MHLLGMFAELRDRCTREYIAVGSLGLYMFILCMSAEITNSQMRTKKL